jgi:hypothetical protein
MFPAAGQRSNTGSWPMMVIDVGCRQRGFHPFGAVDGLSGGNVVQ